MGQADHSLSAFGAMEKTLVEQTLGVGIGGVAWAEIIEDVSNRLLAHDGNQIDVLIASARTRLLQMGLWRHSEAVVHTPGKFSQGDIVACRPSSQLLLPKISKEQRIAQLARVAHEFCSLDFVNADASEQGALTLRMLAILKSFEESTAIYDGEARSDAGRAELLGLGTNETINLGSVVRKADACCSRRKFRDAFEVMQTVVPTFRCRIAALGNLSDKQMCRSFRPSTQVLEKTNTTACRKKFRSDGEKMSRLRRQVEYYFSDQNLAKDEYFRALIDESEHGWVAIRYIMACPIIKMRAATVGDVVTCLAVSIKLEVRTSPSTSVRRVLDVSNRLGLRLCPRAKQAQKELLPNRTANRRESARQNGVVDPWRRPAPQSGGRTQRAKRDIKAAAGIVAPGPLCKGRGRAEADLFTPGCGTGKGKTKGRGKVGGGFPKPLTLRSCTQEETPTPGMTVERCGAGDLTRLRHVWSMRAGKCALLDAWRVDNPLRTLVFKKRREHLKGILGREADGLEGFHGTHPDAIMSICENGLDKNRRSGQVFGVGEYFAKDPSVSIGYCRGGQYMLLCRLTLGVESSTPSNTDGDHIWVPEKGFYVIKEPEQVLPQYIVRFASDCSYEAPELRSRSWTRDAEIVALTSSTALSEGLEEILSHSKWSTKSEEQIKAVPRQRKCFMSKPFATVLWLGFLHSHLSDARLEDDVRAFLTQHARQYVGGLRVQIVKGHFKKAHAILQTPIPRELVHKLNDLPFVENGVTRTICVDDGHGSPGQECPKFIAGYCRGQNLRFTHPCWCSHPTLPTQSAQFQLSRIPLESAKGAELSERFIASSPFQRSVPRIRSINAIINPVLSRCHEEYRKYLVTKHMEEPVVQELYHGTNNNILDIIYTHGLQPPSDMQASDMCPYSGGKGLCTSLCNNHCKYCVNKHEWNHCHMYGLGIYLADLAQKSHKYVSQPRVGEGGRLIYRMVICSVLGKSFQLEGNLTSKDAMHDVVNVRTLTDDLMDDMVDRCQECLPYGEDFQGMSCDNFEVAEKSDLLFVKGLGKDAKRGCSVAKSEYIAFHPHQCLPKYEIEYELQ